MIEIYFYIKNNIFLLINKRVNWLIKEYFYDIFGCIIYFLEFFISWLFSILFFKDINFYFYELNKVFERNEDWSFV